MSLASKAIFMNNPMEDSSKRVCGALNRQGKQCQKPPLKGKTRCMLHGGKTPASQNSGKSNGHYRHGLYSPVLTEAEKAAWPSVPLGNVDDEIRMLKIQYARALTLESEIDQEPNSAKHMRGFQLTEVRQSSDANGNSTDAISRRPDISGRMNWIIGRIALLERTRIDLNTAARDSGEGIDEKARDLVEAMKLMTDLEMDHGE